MRATRGQTSEQMMPNSNGLTRTRMALLTFGLLVAIGQLASGSISPTRDQNQLQADALRSNSTTEQLNGPIEQQVLHPNHNLPPHADAMQASPSSSREHAQYSTPANPSPSNNSHNHNKAPKSARISSPRNRCILAERELDRCSARLIGLGQAGGLSYPDSMQELDSVYCPRFRETVACVKNNTDCYKPFERQIINWILSSTKKMNYKRCKSENEKIRFLKLTSSCFALMRSPMDDCMGRYIGQLDAVAEFGRELERLSDGGDHQIQLACCANHRFKQCIMRGARQGCHSSHDQLKKLRRTSSLSSQRAARRQLARHLQDTMDDLKSTLDEMALTGPEFICNGVDEKFCRLHFDGRYSNRLAKHRSIVPAMIKIYANK